MHIFTIPLLLLLQSFPPVSHKLVNDYTQTLDQNEVVYLEDLLVRYEDSTSNQIAIVILNNIGDYDIGMYTTELARAWGIGSKKNNGILLLMSKEDRRVFIASGYGLEGALPDVIIKRIIEDEFIPNAKRGNYFEALHSSVIAVIKAIEGTYTKEGERGQKSSIVGLILFLIIVLLCIFIFSRRGRNGGGGAGLLHAAPLLFLGSGRRSSGFGGGGGFGGFGGGSFGGGGSGGSW